MIFLGAQIYATMLITTTVPAKITVNKSIEKGLVRPLEYDGQKYSATIDPATKKAASQIRRCQKRVNATGLILPPTSYANLLIL